MSNILSNQVALVTGASRGIGAAGLPSDPVAAVRGALPAY